MNMLIRHTFVTYELFNLYRTIQIVSGGWLFEWYFFNIGKQSMLIKYNQHMRSADAPSLELLESIYQEHDGPWLMWLMTSLYQISQKVNTQLQYVSLLSEWKGLSTKGRDVMSGVSSITSGNTYERFKKRIQEYNDEEVDTLISTGVFTWWADNYSHSIFRNIPTVSSTMYSHKMWTSLVLLRTSSKVDLDIGGRYKECLPRDIRGLLPGAGNLKDMIKDLHVRRDLYETLVYKYNVSWTPIRPTREYISNERLSRLLPVDVLRSNVGSQEGLLEVLKYIIAKFGQRKDKMYTVGTVDTNIYWRLIKVIT